MKITDKLLEFDESFKNWLIHHRIKWCLVLIFLGMFLGLSGVFFIGMKLEQGIISGIGYTTLLLLVELSSGGKGVN